MFGSSKLALPPRGALPKTNDEDPVDYYYRPLTARMYRGRLELTADLLGPGPFEAVLDVGYGSGIFIPELTRRADRVVGLEIHGEATSVEDALKRLGIDAELRSGDVLAMPFADESFDGIVCLSVLEHLTELDAALTELRRVARPGAVVVLGFPVRNFITDSFFRLAGYDPRRMHPSSNREIFAAVERHAALQIERRAHSPQVVPLALSGYAACRCRAA